MSGFSGLITVIIFCFGGLSKYSYTHSEKILLYFEKCIWFCIIEDSLHKKSMVPGSSMERHLFELFNSVSNFWWYILGAVVLLDVLVVVLVNHWYLLLMVGYRLKLLNILLHHILLLHALILVWHMLGLILRFIGLMDFFRFHIWHSFLDDFVCLCSIILLTLLDFRFLFRASTLMLYLRSRGLLSGRELNFWFLWFMVEIYNFLSGRWYYIWVLVFRHFICSLFRKSIKWELLLEVQWLIILKLLQLIDWFCNGI